MPVQQNEDTQALDRICGGDLSPDTPRLKEGNGLLPAMRAAIGEVTPCARKFLGFLREVPMLKIT